RGIRLRGAGRSGCAAGRRDGAGAAARSHPDGHHDAGAGRLRGDAPAASASCDPGNSDHRGDGDGGRAATGAPGGRQRLCPQAHRYPRSHREGARLAADYGTGELSAAPLEGGEDATSASWPPSPDAPLLDSVAQAWKESVFTPGRFFPQLSREQPLGPSIWYYIALGIIASGITLFWRMVYPAAHLSYHLGRMSGGFQEVQPLQDFLFAPLILIISLFISAGVVHLTLMILRGATSGFATTVRVFCFA